MNALKRGTGVHYINKRVRIKWTSAKKRISLSTPEATLLPSPLGKIRIINPTRFHPPSSRHTNACTGGVELIKYPYYHESDSYIREQHDTCGMNLFNRDLLLLYHEFL